MLYTIQNPFLTVTLSEQGTGLGSGTHLVHPAL